MRDLLHLRDVGFVSATGNTQLTTLSLGDKITHTSGPLVLSQLAEHLPRLQTSGAYRVNTESALVAPLSAHVGIKVGYVLRYDSNPPPKFRWEVPCPTGNSHEEPRWVEGRQPVRASTRMPHNIRMHMTGSSGLRLPPPADDAGRSAALHSLEQQSNGNANSF